MSIELGILAAMILLAAASAAWLLSRGHRAYMSIEDPAPRPGEHLGDSEQEGDRDE